LLLLFDLNRLPFLLSLGLDDDDDDDDGDSVVVVVVFVVVVVDGEGDDRLPLFLKRSDNVFAVFEAISNFCLSNFAISIVLSFLNLVRNEPSLFVIVLSGQFVIVDSSNKG
jgi:hypothetical protein